MRPPSEEDVKENRMLAMWYQYYAILIQFITVSCVYMQVYSLAWVRVDKVYQCNLCMHIFFNVKLFHIYYVSVY